MKRTDRIKNKKHLRNAFIIYVRKSDEEENDRVFSPYT